jgi:hypothetical protein
MLTSSAPSSLLKSCLSLGENFVSERNSKDWDSMRVRDFSKTMIAFRLSMQGESGLGRAPCRDGEDGSSVDFVMHLVQRLLMEITVP